MKTTDGALEILFHVKAIFVLDTEKKLTVLSGSMSFEEMEKIVEGFTSTSMYKTSKNSGLHNLYRFDCDGEGGIHIVSLGDIKVID